MTPIRRALLSAADRTGLAELARALTGAGAEIVATGGTARHLREAGIAVRPLEQVTGFPELLGGRVKTLHPAVHAALLARDDPRDLTELARHAIAAIDLVAVTLYPFEQAVAAGAAMAAAVEEIDIGGVALLRAAAKNWARVTVLADPVHYPLVIEALAAGGVPEALRLRLAAEAFARVAAYDAAIAAYFQRAAGQARFPDRLTLTFSKLADLRYGENPHQRGALYAAPGGAGGVVGAQVLGGRALSYNNIADLEAAWALAGDLPAPAVVIVKHLNPCGAAVAVDLREAFVRARDSDPVAAFGGVVATNVLVDAGAAQAMGELFLEAIIAPAFEPGALEILRSKKNLRLIAVGQSSTGADAAFEFRSVRGGMLLQDADRVRSEVSGWRVVTERQPTPAEWEDLRFAWAICAHVKSNAIVFAKDRQVVGVGAGQMSRVDSVRLAAHKAAGRAAGAVAASDAFFPFADGVEAAAAAGVTAIVQPGGSVRDAEVIEAARRLGLAMVLTGERHFRH
ncbi:MAG: bifunctional phosphoribosylaminoimidazolecarboxamide formyltransferase/IMP cyclohydrolase [Armatimonadota bacterium]|nr:bifunctional phosphoribosylaminoimidazolecarboxamide formyltransferase/IMP cyclohydrolase [Armatimonadota bacterium]MDR7454863.1 bifunctional phosphoribosylaminoimidazolecarboxamide formyltransferase/IMP cyclohydrolase [Armatimonadota bacterium]MDR7457816.1 bifunctional phosphoribosylaminoimidazolecarboxamide formyltransferase/IMP cyclohydrolase [Armatimonadota bacterium]MDR7497704.1 bifunctional phosphoribosylaminoimidazolecarboxamide formyltransferase/IMP cyclohydrolase [Armatimonadota bact